MRDTRYRWFKISLKGPDHKSKSYIFRVMSKREYDVMLTKQTEFDRQEYVLTTCVENYEGITELQGTCETLITQILEESGWNPESSMLIERVFAWMSDEDSINECAAITMIAGCTLDTLANADPLERLKYLAVGRRMFEVYTSQTGRTLQEIFGFETVAPETDIRIGE